MENESVPAASLEFDPALLIVAGFAIVTLLLFLGYHTWSGEGAPQQTFDKKTFRSDCIDAARAGAALGGALTLVSHSVFGFPDVSKSTLAIGSTIAGLLAVIYAVSDLIELFTSKQKRTKQDTAPTSLN